MQESPTHAICTVVVLFSRQLYVSINSDSKNLLRTKITCIRKCISAAVWQSLGEMFFPPLALYEV